MRRRPTIISYKPPAGDDLDAASPASNELADVIVDSDHMILDRATSSEAASGHHSGNTSISNHNIHPGYLQDHAHDHVQSHPHHHHLAKASRIEVMRMDSEESANVERHDLTKLAKSLVVYIDGPFGAPTSQIFRAQHAVLIGTGIGVTPFASILQSIMHRYWQARNTCPKCQYKWTNDLSASVGLNLRKVCCF